MDLKWAFLLLAGVILPSSGSTDCEIGYQAKGKRCVDEDECKANPCGNNAQCINTEGSYYCTCKTGFHSKTANFTATTGQCEDVDECKKNPCGNYSQCINTEGSYYCTCKTGFRSKTANFTATTGQCEDINECTVKEPPCPSDMVCQNSIGSYKCKQMPSFTDSPQLDKQKMVYYCMK